MTVNTITDTKKGRTGIALTYLHTTRLIDWLVGWLVRCSLKRCDVPVSRCRHRGPRSLLSNIVVVRWRRTSSLTEASSSSVSTVRRRRRSPPLPTAVIVGRRRGEEQFHYCWRRLPGFRLVVLSVSFTMGNPSLGNTYSTLHSVLTATSGSALMPEPASRPNPPSRSNASAMASLVWS